MSEYGSVFCDKIRTHLSIREVKGAGIDVMFRTPLVVTKTAAAALHDKLVLFVCCASLRFHTGNRHKL